MTSRVGDYFTYSSSFWGAAARYLVFAPERGGTTFLFRTQFSPQWGGGCCLPSDAPLDRARSFQDLSRVFPRLILSFIVDIPYPLGCGESRVSNYFSPGGKGKTKTLHLTARGMWTGGQASEHTHRRPADDGQEADPRRVPGHAVRERERKHSNKVDATFERKGKHDGLQKSVLFNLFVRDGGDIISRGRPKNTTAKSAGGQD